MAIGSKSSPKKTEERVARPTTAKAKKVVAPKVAGPIVEGHQRRKIITGVVTSNKMQKTIVVKIERQVRHAMYGKFITNAKKFKAHDEKNEAKVGDIVAIIESRPLSREKRWALQKIVRRAIQTVEANV